MPTSCDTVDLSKVISLDDAAKKARGEQDGTVTAWKIEAKSDKAQYEFDIRPQGASEDKEVQINAMDGSVIKSG